MTATPCDGCRTVHPGIRCLPGPKPRLWVYLPEWLDTEFRARVPWGERSAYIARVLADALGVGR